MARQGHPCLARRSSRPSDRWQMRFWRGVASKLSWPEAVAYRFSYVRALGAFLARLRALDNQEGEPT
jgi:hypothetical protein